MNEQKEFKLHIPADKMTPEIIVASIAMGIVLTVVFGAANAYLDLRVGMTISTPIPAVVIVMGVIRRVMCKRSTLESNLVRTIDPAGESLATGAIFTLSALLLWAGEGKMETPGILEITLIAFIGGILGVLFTMSLRNALTVKEYSILPYPEGTACAEVLLAGEEDGVNASTVFVGMGTVATFKFITGGLKLMPSEVSFRVKGYAEEIGTQIYPVVMSVGYICGLRTFSYMSAGGIVSQLVLTPAIVLFGADLTLYPGMEPIGQISAKGGAGTIWGSYIHYIGTGALAVGGTISLVRSLPLIIRIFRDAMKDLTGVRSEGDSRISQDLNMKPIIIGIAVLTPLIWLVPVIPVTLMGVIIAVTFGFFSATASSRMVGLVGGNNNPVSSMAIATLLTATVALKMTGDSEIYGIQRATVIGSIICIVAAIAGDMSQDLKTGYPLGATPKKRQIGESIGIISAAFAIGGVLYLLDVAWGLGSEELGASQAMLMKIIIEGVVESNPPWALVLMGVFLAAAVEAAGIPVLPFVIGVCLPAQLSACIMAGGLVHLVFDRMKREEKEKETIVSDGLFYCSGMITGEGLVRILLALLVVFGLNKAIDLSRMLNLPAAFFNIGSLVVLGLVVLTPLRFSLWKRRKTVQVMMGENKKMGSENYLDKIPMRSEGISWSTDGAGIMTLNIENTGVPSRIVQKLLHKPKVSRIHLDQMGSYVWPLMDGKRSLLDLGKLVEAQFGDEASSLYERLAKYMQILDSYHSVKWKQ